MAAPSYIYTGTDGTISITGLTLQPAGTVVTGATVTGTLKDASGNAVASWTNMALADQGSGTYTAAFSAANVPAKGTYQFVVTAVKTGLTITVEHDVVVQDLQV
jgi:hypothetical protein